MASEKEDPYRREYRDRMLLESEHAPGGVILYYADGGEEIIRVNQYIVDLFECESVDEFLELVHGSFRGFVYTDDVDASEDSIWGQVDARDSYDHIYYRIRTKSGKLVNVDDYGRLVEEHDGLGSRPVFHVFIKAIEQGGSVDWLTGLPDMARFLHLAQLGVDALFERGERPAVLALDLVGLKAYNMKYGAMRATGCCRRSPRRCAATSAGKLARGSRKTITMPTHRARCSDSEWTPSSTISETTRKCRRCPSASEPTC